MVRVRRVVLALLIITAITLVAVAYYIHAPRIPQREVVTNTVIRPEAPENHLQHLFLEAKHVRMFETLDLQCDIQGSIHHTLRCLDLDRIGNPLGQYRNILLLFTL